MALTQTDLDALDTAIASGELTVRLADRLAASGTIFRCLILDSDLSVRGTVRVIAAGTNTLTLNSPTISPVAGDVIALAAYDSWGTSAERDYLHARYAYLADAADTVGSAGDDPYEWEG